jgi:hypothetical protein
MNTIVKTTPKVVLSKILLPLLFFCQILALSECTADTLKKENQQQIEEENFDSFYKKFYADSVFQVSRIIFPLKGFNSDARDPELGDKNPPYFWKKNEWSFLSTLDKDMVKDVHEDGVDIYRKVLKRNKNLTVIEKIFREESGYSEERQFKKNKGKWFLVYYRFSDV